MALIMGKLSEIGLHQIVHLNAFTFMCVYESILELNVKMAKDEFIRFCALKPWKITEN